LLVVQLLGWIDFLLHEAAYALCERVDVFGLIKVHAGLSQMRKKWPLSIGGETRALVYDLDAHDSSWKDESNPALEWRVDPDFQAIPRQNAPRWTSKIWSNSY
jgi:hypothetical protein